MPIYTDPYTGTGRPLDLTGYKPSTGEVFRSSFDHALDTNPVASFNKLLAIKTNSEWGEYSDTDGFSISASPEEIAEAYAPRREAMPIEEQRKYLEESGVGGQLQPHESYDREVLDILIDGKKLENYRSFISEKATFWQGAAGLGAGFAASMLDPINLASSVIPVPGLGAARMMPLLAGAKGAAGRTGLRLLEGAASGAVGAAVVEPLVYSGQQALQADYDLASSLMNIGFGAAMGAGMKAAHGLWREHAVAKKGGPQEWEFAPQSEHTEAVRQRLEKEMFEARKDTLPETQWDTLREQIAGEVATYDAFVRHVSFKEQITPDAVYDRYKIDFYNGEIFDRKVLDAKLLFDKHGKLTQEISDIAQLEAMRAQNQELRIADQSAELARLQEELDLVQRKMPEAIRITEAERIARESGPASLNQSLIPGMEAAPAAPARTTHANVSPTGSPRIQGDQTGILLNNSISTKPDAAHYEVRELTDVIASHDPNNGYRRRDAYPEGAQERPYHSDEGEQTKVWSNALAYNPGHVVSTARSAMEGPPIIRQDGVVLGGNSRTMTLELVYGQHPEKAEAYRQELMANAERWFGIDPKAIEGMRQPILVRVIEEDLDADKTILKSREYNQVLTQEIQEFAKGVSLGKRIGSKSISALAEGLEDFNGNLDKFLNSPKSSDFIYALIDDGVIMETERTTLVNPDGTLNDNGQKIVRNAFLGRVCPDYDVLAALSKDIRGKLDGIAAHILRTQQFGREWDISGHVYLGLQAIVDAQKAKRPLKTLFDSVAIEGTARTYSPQTKLFAFTLEGAKDSEAQIRFARYAQEADKARGSAGGLMAEFTVEPWDVLDRCFNSDVIKIGTENPAVYMPFRPNESGIHETLAWALKEKYKTVTEVRQGIELALTKNPGQEERALLEQRKAALGGMSGKIAYYEPQLHGFREKQYHEIKGDTAEARKAWEEKMARIRAEREAADRIAMEEAQRKKAEREQWEREHPEEAAQQAREREEREARRKAEQERKAEEWRKAASGQATNAQIEAAKKILQRAGLWREGQAAPEKASPEGPAAGKQEAPGGYGEAPEARQIDNFESRRAAVTFIESARETRAIIRFFRQADLTSGSHELFHVIARQLEDLAMRDGGDPYWKKQWAKMNEFVGAKDGEAWTAEMHEKFARAGERYLLEGKAPTAQLEPIFEKMKENFIKAYVDADAAGLEISDGMRKLFDDILTVPVIEGSQRIQQGIARMNSYNWAESFYTGDSIRPDADARLLEIGGDIDAGRAIVDNDTAELARTLDMLEKSGEEMNIQYAAEIRNDMEMAEREVRKAQEKGRLLQELMACNARFN